MWRHTHIYIFDSTELIETTEFLADVDIIKLIMSLVQRPLYDLSPTIQAGYTELHVTKMIFIEISRLVWLGDFAERVRIFCKNNP